MEGKTAILVDDGLATGSTMIAAARAVRKRGPRAVIVAVPASPRRRWDGEADELIVLYVSDEHPFAVASFYEEWTEMTDEEARGCGRAMRGTTAKTGRRSHACARRPQLAWVPAHHRVGMPSREELPAPALNGTSAPR